MKSLHKMDNKLDNNPGGKSHGVSMFNSSAQKPSLQALVQPPIANSGSGPQNLVNGGS